MKRKTKKEVEKGDGNEELRAQLVRALADYDNLKKRVEREREEYEEYATANFFMRVMPVLDMIEQVQKHLGDSGLAIALSEMADKLKTEGIEAIEPRAGDVFDTEVMEAVEVRRGKEGSVLELGLKGWKMGDKILRHAKVVVGRKE